jgi:23S rRNA (cytosine1962-C5)-methyltransferase
MESLPSKQAILSLLQQALAARSALTASGETNALRLFNGFYEGFPGLVVDLYDRTLVIFDHRESPSRVEDWLVEIRQFYLQQLPQINCVVHKMRSAADARQRNGILAYGDSPVGEVLEFDVRHAVDLLLNRDASFYLDTRLLRRWLLQHSQGLKVLNCFAYTGSLGVAALAGGAKYVLQTDLNRSFLALARRSCMLNHLDLGKMKLRAVDFFREVGDLKKQEQRFDLVLLDPPFFSITEKGKVDLQASSTRLINKVRPLVNNHGRIVAVNNSLYLSGAEYLQSIEELCSDGYLSLEEIIPVPEDVTGTPETIKGTPPVSPEPFNHPTKIVILNVKRGQG